LDAILSPEWQFRYYSFDSHWAKGEMMASMRNGSGDQWFALFCEAGVVIHGLAHEASVFRVGNPWPGIFETIPPQFAAFVDEPAFDARNSTFCLWHTSPSGWERGPVEFPDTPDPDGSEGLLAILDNNPRTYQAWAENYHEISVDLAVVADVYRHIPLTQEHVQALNKTVAIADLAEDLQSIGYPCANA
jgi:hypothetical protein